MSGQRHRLVCLAFMLLELDGDSEGATAIGGDYVPPGFIKSCEGFCILRLTHILDAQIEMMRFAAAALQLFIRSTRSQELRKLNGTLQ